MINSAAIVKLKSLKMISLWRRQERYRIIYVWNTTKELTNVSNILSLTLLMIIGLIEMIYLWNQLNALYFGHLHCLYPLYPPDWTSNQGVSNLLYSVTLCSKHKDCREGGWGCAHCAGARVLHCAHCDLALCILCRCTCACTQPHK